MTIAHTWGSIELKFGHVYTPYNSTREHVWTVTQRLKAWPVTPRHGLYGSMFNLRPIGFKENVTIHFKVFFTLKI